MSSPASSLGWELVFRHRWGLAALAGYFGALGVLRLMPGTTGSALLSDPTAFALATFVPLSAGVIYLLGVFSFGLSGDLAARRSVYPGRLMVLPLSTPALAGLPALYGSAAMIALWVLIRTLGVWPPDVEVPLIWPGLLGVVMLAWVQALTWTPFPLPGLRVLVCVAWLSLVGVTIVLALELAASEWQMLALLVPQLPLAWALARVAVRRARRGDEPDWSERAPDMGALPGAARRRRPFGSPLEAQEWLEWRRYGRSLPILVAAVLPFELALLWVSPDAPSLVRAVVAAALATPPFMAAFAAAAVSDGGAEATDAYELTPFVAARPLSSAALVGAKLRAATRSALAAWLVVAAGLPIGLWLSGTGRVVVADLVWLSGRVGARFTLGASLLAVVLVVLSTWKTLVAGLYVGMSGRAWLVKASVFATLAFLTAACVAVPRLLESGRAIVWAWEGLPGVLAVLAALKMGLAVWIVTRLHRSGLVQGRTLVRGAVVWDAAVLLLYAVLVWLAPALVFRLWGLGLCAILAIPLVRVSGAPLMAAWNRHR